MSDLVKDDRSVGTLWRNWPSFEHKRIPSLPMLIFQMFWGFCYMMIGADFSGIDGRSAQRLGLPLGVFATWSFFLIPAVAMFPFVLPRRISRWKAILACDVLALSLVFVPSVILRVGTRSIGLPEGLPAGMYRELEAELGFPIVIQRESSGSSIWFSRAHDAGLIREALHRHGVGIARSSGIEMPIGHSP
jgi:hypothetical protein